MLSLSEIVIKPGKSEAYLRLVFVLYLLSVLLVIHSSMYFLIKLLIGIALVYQFKDDYLKQSPCPMLNEIRYSKKGWILLYADHSQTYQTATILIHNPLFFLVKLSGSNKNKLLILFNDQLPNEQLRLLHLKTGIK